MFNQVVVSWSFTLRGIHQESYRLKLMIPGEDHRFLLDLAAIIGVTFLDLKVKKPGHQVEQAVAGQNLFPQVGSAVSTLLAQRVSGPSVFAPLVEGKEVRCRAGQPSGHKDKIRVSCKVDQCPSLEFEDWFTRITVFLVLSDGVLDSLARQMVL